MHKIILLFKWFFSKFWPVWIPGLLAAVHITVAFACSIEMKEANKIISLSLQIAGGLLILYSIDSNIGIVKNDSLFTLFKSLIKTCPLIKTTCTIQLDNLALKCSMDAVVVRPGYNGTTVEEHIEYLQNQIEWLKNDLKNNTEQFTKLITNLEQRMKLKIDGIRTEVTSVEKKITDISVGGIGLQIFGVILMCYGSIAGYFA